MLDVSRLYGSLISAILVLLASCLVAQASQLDHLYRAKAVVSGQGEANRMLGFAQCLKDVLVKVSGDQRLLDDARVTALASKAGELVAAYSYRDRLGGIPIHDEQGSYDRPHDLTVEFDPAKLDYALSTLGREPWLSRRPQVDVSLNVVPRTGAPFLLSRDGAAPAEADMRVALEAAAERVGLSIGFEPDSGGDRQRDAALGDNTVLLSGELIWSDEAKGWIAEWSLVRDRKAHRWRVRGVGFDDAFRNGLRGTAQILSGNGEPGSS